MAVLDLREHAANYGLTLSRPDELSAEDRRAAIGTWKGRMVNEHVSARVFAGLIPHMMAAEIDTSLQMAVANMIQDELRHGIQCAAVVHALGGDPYAEIPTLSQVPAHEDVDPVEALTRNILSVSCLSETVAVALVGAERLSTGPAEIEQELKGILADEVQHARFGWKLLDSLAPRFDDAMRDRLGDYLVTAFIHLQEYELAHLPLISPPSETAEQYGVCDGNHARKLFFETVDTVIVPGLEKRGLPGAEAWKYAKQLH